MQYNSALELHYIKSRLTLNFLEKWILIWFHCFPLPWKRTQNLPLDEAYTFDLGGRIESTLVFFLYNNESCGIKPSFWKQSNWSCSCALSYCALRLKIMAFLDLSCSPCSSKWPFFFLFLKKNASVAPRNLSVRPWAQVSKFPIAVPLKPKTFLLKCLTNR